MTTLTAPFLPQPLDDAEVVFPTSVAHLMPDYAEIPDEFKRYHGNPWVEFQTDWFFSGIKDLEISPRDGIDKRTALRHLKTIQGSWDPKHEHKQAAVAFLASQWFTRVCYNVGGQRREVSS